MRARPSTPRHPASILPLLLVSALLGFTFAASNNVEANHPVLVEGNCDSPVPGTTLVSSPGTCGDFDGDGRIGTAEDTDGADRIFGTISAALGFGTGAAAGTGANMNGTVTIVKSGRFPEALALTPGTGNFTHGNVTLQAAPGVEAQIDAVFQGDPGGGNNARQAATGVSVNGSGSSTVILRNLTIRNWNVGIETFGATRLTVDNCRVENNVNYGIRARDTSQVAVHNSNVNATGYRVGSLGTCPSGGCVPNPGHAISFEVAAAGTVTQTLVSNNFNRAISNTGAGVVTYRGVFVHNNGGVPPIFGATRVDF